jgi:hypothetical protein
MNPLLTKSRVAGAAVNGNRFVKPGASDNQVLLAAAATDSIIGVSDPLGGVSGGRVDVHVCGIVEVELGGTVAAGAQLTADSVGRGVTAASTNRTGGIALVAGVSGDIIDVLLAPGLL